MVPQGVSLLAQGTDGGQRLKGASLSPQGSQAPGMAQWAGSILEGNVYSKNISWGWKFTDLEDGQGLFSH